MPVGCVSTSYFLKEGNIGLVKLRERSQPGFFVRLIWEGNLSSISIYGFMTVGLKWRYECLCLCPSGERGGGGGIGR